MGADPSDERNNTMSFVNLMANDVWSDADILRRTESMIRSEFSQDAETILNRKVMGMQLGTYTPTEEEMAELARYNSTVLAAQAEGVQARIDMALLNQVFPLEDAQRRLDRMSLTVAWDRLQLPVVEPIIDEITQAVTNAAEIAQDTMERAMAQSAIDPYIIREELVDSALDSALDSAGAPVMPPVLDPVAVERDNAERAAAQAVIDNAPEDVKNLFDLRKTRYQV